MKEGREYAAKRRAASARYQKNKPRIKGKLTETEKAIMADAEFFDDNNYKKKTPK